ncbi:MAG: HAD-IA family hydrolase [Oscillospiraceae bacterium]|nr:HAD-IA family hydrolase [Oscillospiraceae bacterium]
MSDISVIMGVYNCPEKQMLKQAVDSVLNQTYTDFEFIICDDGSTNDTPLWLSEISEKDSRIIVIKSEKNCGLAVALNKCLEKAGGRYIARQDVDDISMENRFKIQVEYLDNHRNVSFVGSDCFLYDSNGLFGERHMPQCPSRRDFLFNSPFIHGTTMFRREIFEKCGGYKLIGRCNKYEDYEFFMRAYANNFLGANINQLLYTFYSEERKNKVPLKMRFDEYEVRKEGFRLLDIPCGKRFVYTHKPLLLLLIPNKILNVLKERKKNSLMHKQSFSLKLYKIIVNRNSYIKFNYERYVNTNRARHQRFPVLSWMYLLKLNAESVLLNKESRESVQVKGIEQKESVLKLDGLEVANRLCQAEVVSFDIFDTLIFRPFAVPSDLFYFVGEKLNYPDFRTIRIEAEKTARRNKGGETVSLKDIYDFISERTGIDSELGQKTEMEIEYDLCTANPAMKDVWEFVKLSGKKVILTSDMYLPSEFIEKIIKKNGFDGYDEIYISNEYGCGKHDGMLYEIIKDKLGTSDISHIGDNYGSDVRNAKEHGLTPYEYKNVNATGNIYRPKEMSQIIGSAYSGIINRKLYSGNIDFSPAYEYGYKYGGILILGFCEYIRKIHMEKKSDKILFFSRDGYIVKKIYDRLYPEDKTEYVHWSRNAAAKLGADLFRDNFIKRFITQKINHNNTIYDIMHSIGISEWDFPFSLQDTLDMKTAGPVEKFITENWDRIIDSYSDMDKAARMYFDRILENCSSVLTVDCGWAGSGNIILDKIVNEKWKMNCELTGVLAGSNSYNQYDSDYSETFLLNGKMKVYCFSSGFNRDKYKFHNPSAGHNIYFELLFSAPEPGFKEFRLRDGECELVFDDEVENEMYIREIQKGETEFADEYVSVFRNYEFMRNISGSDAYAPFMDAMKHSRKYIDKVFSECIFDETTNGIKERIIRR